MCLPPSISIYCFFSINDLLEFYTYLISPQKLWDNVKSNPNEGQIKKQGFTGLLYIFNKALQSPVFAVFTRTHSDVRLWNHIPAGS
jgi:hypothetical protein